MNKESSKKRVAVLFSSGLDSTYLVYKNLEEGNHVLPVYVEITNNINKVKIEKQNIFMLYELFVEKYGHDLISKPIIVTEVSVNNYSHEIIFTQLPIWIFSISYLTYSDLDEIQIAYVSNDDAISYISEIKKFYKAHKWLHRGKQPKLLFPLIKLMKYEIMEKLPSQYKPYLTSCENPILLPYFMKVKRYGTIERLQFYEPCGCCVPCERIIRDELSYNDTYGKLIDERKERNKLGEKFFYYKKYLPAEYNTIHESLSLATLNLCSKSDYIERDGNDKGSE